MADSISDNGITVNLNIATPDNDGFIYISVVSTSVGTLSKRKSKIFELKIGPTSVAKVTAKSTSDANMKKAAKDFKSLLDKFAAKFICCGGIQFIKLAAVDLVCCIILFIIIIGCIIFDSIIIGIAPIAIPGAIGG